MYVWINLTWQNQRFSFHNRMLSQPSIKLVESFQLMLRTFNFFFANACHIDIVMKYCQIGWTIAWDTVFFLLSMLSFLESGNGTNRMFYKLFVCESWVFTKIRYNRIECVASAMRAYRQLEENKSFQPLDACIVCTSLSWKVRFSSNQYGMNIGNRFVAAAAVVIVSVWKYPEFMQWTLISNFIFFFHSVCSFKRSKNLTSLMCDVYHRWELPIARISHSYRYTFCSSSVFGGVYSICRNGAMIKTKNF